MLAPFGKVSKEATDIELRAMMPIAQILKFLNFTR